MRKKFIFATIILCMSVLLILAACTTVEEPPVNNDESGKTAVLPEFSGQKTDITREEADRVIDDIESSEGMETSGLKEALDMAEEYKVFQAEDETGGSVKSYLEDCVTAGFIFVEKGVMGEYNFEYYESADKQSLIVIEKEGVYTFIYYKTKYEEKIYVWPEEKLIEFGLGALTQPEGSRLTAAAIDEADRMGRVPSVDIQLTDVQASYYDTVANVLRNAGYVLDTENDYGDGEKSATYVAVRGNELYYADLYLGKDVPQDGSSAELKPFISLSVYNATAREIAEGGKQIIDIIGSGTIKADVTVKRKDYFEVKDEATGEIHKEYGVVEEVYTETLIYDNECGVILTDDSAIDGMLFLRADGMAYRMVNHGRNKAPLDGEKIYLIRNFLTYAWLWSAQNYYASAKNVTSTGEEQNVGGYTIEKREGQIEITLDNGGEYVETNLTMTFWVEKTNNVALGYEYVTENREEKVLVSSISDSTDGLEEYAALPDEYELEKDMPLEKVLTGVDPMPAIPAIDGASGYYVSYYFDSYWDEETDTYTDYEACALYAAGVSDAELGAYRDKLIASGAEEIYEGEYVFGVNATCEVTMRVYRAEFDGLAEAVRFEFSIEEIRVPEFFFSDKSLQFYYNLTDFSGQESERNFASKIGNETVFIGSNAFNGEITVIYEVRGLDCIVAKSAYGEETTYTLSEFVEMISEYAIFSYSPDKDYGKNGSAVICGVTVDVYENGESVIYYSEEYALAFKVVEYGKTIFEITEFTQVSDDGKGADGAAPMYKGAGKKYLIGNYDSGTRLEKYLEPCFIYQVYDAAEADVIAWKNELDAAGLVEVDYYLGAEGEQHVYFLMTDGEDYCVYAMYTGGYMTIIEGVLPNGIYSYFGDEFEPSLGSHDIAGTLGDGAYTIIYTESRTSDDGGEEHYMEQEETFTLDGELLFDGNTYYKATTEGIERYHYFIEFGTLKTMYADKERNDIVDLKDYLNTRLPSILRSIKDLSNVERYSLTGNASVAGRDCTVYEGKHIERGLVYDVKYYVDDLKEIYLKIERSYYDEYTGERVCYVDEIRAFDNGATIADVPDFESYLNVLATYSAADWKEEYLGYDFNVSASGYDSFSVNAHDTFGSVVYYGENVTAPEITTDGEYHLIDQFEDGSYKRYDYYGQDGTQAMIEILINESYYDSVSQEEIHVKNIKIICYLKFIAPA